jgi:drug/metabolite transporter (DMT)-like permease
VDSAATAAVVCRPRPSPTILPDHSCNAPRPLLFALLWIPVTLVAAAAQTARNATQRSLTASIGTVGATQVRFLYGLPFALLFLCLVAWALGEAPPVPGAEALGFTLAGALSQILATALMLKAMQAKSFAVTTATIKTEPLLTAIVGAALLGDALTPLKLAAILIATAGVVVMSVKPDAYRAMLREAGPALLGIAAGACFGLSAVAFRGGILALPAGGFLLRATTILALGLAIQTAMLLAYLLLFDRRALTRSFAVWKPSLGAGFLGAFASQFWFLGFALTSAANVRTLALVEVFMAQAVSRRLFAEGTTRREYAGMALMVAGLALLLLASR